jgi:hypothetical protein
MFQVFHLDVAYVTMALYACFKRMFQVFHMFQTHVASFYLDVAKVDLGVTYVTMSIHEYFK